MIYIATTSKDVINLLKFPMIKALKNSNVVFMSFILSINNRHEKDLFPTQLIRFESKML